MDCELGAARAQKEEDGLKRNAGIYKGRGEKSRKARALCGVLLCVYVCAYVHVSQILRNHRNNTKSILMRQ